MDILQKAHAIVNGARQQDYGDPTGSFKQVATIASILMQKEITAQECCKVMIAVKLARESFKHQEDHLVDLCGYAELLNRIENDT